MKIKFTNSSIVKFYLALLLIGNIGLSFAQSVTSLYTDDLLEQIIGEEEELSVESYLEEFSFFMENPLNLNTATKQQLELFPFLSDIQVENILFYIYTYGTMKTIYELQLVEGMNWQTIQYLIPFVYVAEPDTKQKYPSLRQVFKYGKQEMVTRLDIPFYTKDGYRDYPDSVLQVNPNKKYAGSPFYTSFRYRFRYKDQISFGLTAEKDAGEPFFSNWNRKGYDYYSFYFLMRDFGKLKTLALGNYRLNLGLGLVMNTDYSLGKTSSIATIGYKAGGIKQHSSTDEFNYFRGIAASYQLGKFTVTGFYSHRDIDGIMEGEELISIKKDGMHRTQRDVERKNNVTIQVGGTNIAFQSRYFRFGLTAVYNSFNKKFIPEVKPYSVFYPSGKEFYNIGIDYRYRWQRITLFGETAIDKNNNIASLNVLRFSPLSGYQVLLLHRYYAENYIAWYGRSVSEGSEIRNENGFYIGIEATPFKYWKIAGYADFFRFPWLKYGVNQPSSGFDGLVQASYSPKRNINMFLRYRYKEKDKNYRDKETSILTVEPNIQHKLRYQLNYLPHTNLLFRTTLDYTSVFHTTNTHSNGILLMQTVSYKMVQLPLHLDLNYGLFDSDDYNSRLFVYEKGPIYSFAIPSFYGKGLRSAISIRYVFAGKLVSYIKWSQTRYIDREEMGSGLERIEGNKRNDLYIQLIYKL